MDSSVLKRLRDAATRVLPDEPVIFAYLFGSAAIGKDRPESDVDVAVYLDPSVPEDRYLDLSLGIAGRLEQAARVGNIEVLVLNQAPLGLGGRAVQQRMALYSTDEPARVRYESLILRQFLDFQLHARPLAEKFLRDIAEGRR